MKTSPGSALCIGGLCLLLTLPAIAQEKTLPSDVIPERVSRPFSPMQPRPESSVPFRIPGKKVSQYSSADWGAWIDTTWGPGQGAAVQLQIFDAFWNAIDQRWAGFPNHPLNWDSLRTLYRPQVAAGLGRGRFYGIMTRLWMSTLELHTFIQDQKVDTTYGQSVPRYRSGVPLLIAGTGWWDLLGAPATGMPDGSALVYRAAPGNPLGLAPGDLLLGYEGIPWMNLYQQAVDSGAPVSHSWSLSGSSPESRAHNILSAIGSNWGLFDTIDVVKYSTGDTLHLPTAPLASLSQTIWASDQLPVAGVPMPQGVSGYGAIAVTWGVVQGTSIGYVYVWDWASTQTRILFRDALVDLLQNKQVTGLVIDTRMNWGGNPTLANDGFAQLFNFDPTTNMSVATRTSLSDHLAFSVSGTSWGIAPGQHLYDRPIAVLIGPSCVSAGDMNAFRLRFHPMARLFGQPTNGAFVGGDYYAGTFADGWIYQVPTGIGYSHVPGEGYLIHKGVQPDETVWLTREGVATGDDDVVNRALAWITTLSYAHDVRLSRTSIDTIRVTTRVENPLAHTLSVMATLRNGSGALIDSIALADDGLHGDSAAADGLWGCRYVPSRDDTISVTVRTTDQTAGTSRTLANAVRYLFTRRAEISVDTRSVELGALNLATTQFDTSFFVRNVGYAPDTVVVSLDPVNVVPDYAVSAFPDTLALAPGDSQKVTFRVQPSLLGIQYYQAVVILEPKSAFGPAKFEKNFLFHVVLQSVSELSEIPAAYSLEQNYPNPFNPSTTIRYGLPARSHVELTVYSPLGQRVAVLERGDREAGFHEVKFDATGLPSGVYFCRLTAGPFAEVRKLLLVR